MVRLSLSHYHHLVLLATSSLLHPSLAITPDSIHSSASSAGVITPCQPVRPHDEWRAVDRAHDALVAPDLTRTVSQLTAAVQIFPKMFGAMGTWARTRAEGRAVHRAPSLRLLLSHPKLALQKVSMYELTIHLEGTGRGDGSSDEESRVIGIIRPWRLSCSPLASMRGGWRYHGAEYLGPALLGLDAFAIIDEGGAFSDNFGALFTVLGVTEEGSVNKDMDVQTPDGHSGMPPARTSIGVLIAIVMTMV
ncbi:hypothetical protein FB451DRAFT_1483994 [Mycena latifolia]|nr:hypothetical protein FB451DRAFT_1483994 [Mycena latifolia]